MLAYLPALIFTPQKHQLRMVPKGTDVNMEAGGQWFTWTTSTSAAQPHGPTQKTQTVTRNAVDEEHQKKAHKSVSCNLRADKNNLY